jgi:hypothetical protein
LRLLRAARQVCRGVNVDVLTFVGCFLSPAQSSVAVSGQANFRGGMGRGDALDCHQANA